MGSSQRQALDYSVASPLSLPSRCDICGKEYSRQERHQRERDAIWTSNNYFAFQPFGYDQLQMRLGSRLRKEGGGS